MMIEVTSSTDRLPERKAKRTHVNPIETAIKSWAAQLPLELAEHIQAEVTRLVALAPKRWVVYPPLVILPSGSFEEEWWHLLEPDALQARHKDDLWKKILEGISKREGKGILTHLAVNAGIPLHKNGNGDEENIFRTPSGLIMLHGNFGPDLDPRHPPSEKDFEDALWVSTKQNGITQIWSPRYTMFSRGNIKEKTRLLGFYGPAKVLESRRCVKEGLRKQTAIDLYAGIGYFVFSYVKMGMGRVIGWELNPWSVEGLRRGAIANGWSVKVFQKDDQLSLGHEDIIVVLEDNNLAEERLASLAVAEISHVNCGLLPSSEASWEMALRILKMHGWLHLHENVGVNDIEAKRGVVEEALRGALIRKNDLRDVKVEHIELVKTFAPGVWHCVFDVYIWNSS